MVCRETNQKCNILRENLRSLNSCIYMFLVYSSFAFIVPVCVPRKSTQEDPFETSRQIKL